MGTPLYEQNVECLEETAHELRRLWPSLSAWWASVDHLAFSRSQILAKPGHFCRDSVN